MHEADGPEGAENERSERESGLPDPPDHDRAEDSYEHEGVEGALAIRLLHPTNGLVRDHRRARHVGIDGSQVVDESNGAFTLPDVHLGVDLEQKSPVLAHELAAQLLRHIVRRNGAWPNIPLKEMKLLDEVAGDLAFVEAQRGLDTRAVTALERFTRSEERRVGKECRSRWSPYH